MVCGRCIRAVKEVLNAMNLGEVSKVELGIVEVGAISPEEKDTLSCKLSSLGFELLDDEKSERVAQIKNFIIDEIHHNAQRKKEQQNFSEFITQKLGYDYSYLNDLFSSLEGKTIGQFITLQKIERAKELLVYDQLGLAEIADHLEYNSAQYLSTQFKKITGMTPSQFKTIGKRLTIDTI